MTFKPYFVNAKDSFIKKDRYYVNVVNDGGRIFINIASIESIQKVIKHHFCNEDITLENLIILINNCNGKIFFSKRAYDNETNFFFNKEEDVKNFIDALNSLINLTF